MSTSNQTANYGLSQYQAGDPVKFLTNYNQDMATIDSALKAVKDEADASVPNTRRIAGLALSADVSPAQLIAAGLASGDGSGNAQNAQKLGGIDAAGYALADYGHLIAANGYLGLPNGLFLQWGELTTDSLAVGAAFDTTIAAASLTKPASHVYTANGSVLPLSQWNYSNVMVCAYSDSVYYHVTNGAAAQGFLIKWMALTD